MPQERTNLSGFTQFHHSLIVAVCDSQIHTNGNDLQPSFIRLNDPGPAPLHSILKPAKAVDKESIALNIYTKTAFIGRDDLSIDLRGLRLQEEQVGGCVDLYVVLRLLETGGTEIPHTGKEGLYRLTNCWVKSLCNPANIETLSAEGLLRRRLRMFPLMPACLHFAFQPKLGLFRVSSKRSLGAHCH